MGETIATTETAPAADLKARRRAQTANAVKARQDKALKRRLEAAAALLREAGWKVNEPEADTTP